MKRFLLATMVSVLIVLLGSESVTGKTFDLAPTEIILCPSDDAARLILSFDFSAFPREDGWDVQNAFLEWSTEARPTSAPAHFEVFPIVADWNSATISRGESPVLDRDRVSEWEIEPLDVERNSGGFVRLDVSDIVRRWIHASTEDKGLLVETSSLPPSGLLTEAGGLHLHILYTAAPAPR